MILNQEPRDIQTNDIWKSTFFFFFFLIWLLISHLLTFIEFRLFGKSTSTRTRTAVYLFRFRPNYCSVSVKRACAYVTKSATIGSISSRTSLLVTMHLAN